MIDIDEDSQEERPPQTKSQTKTDGRTEKVAEFGMALTHISMLHVYTLWFSL